MKEDKGCFRHFRLLLALLVVCFAAPFAFGAKAVTAPDSFREKVIDVTTSCHPIFDRLSYTDWPDRDAAEVYELKRDAAAKRDYSMDMLRRYSTVYSDFDIDDEISKQQKNLGIMGMDKETLLDMAIYCETEMFKLIDTESENDYTP